MTATGRTPVRHPDDFYETPAWCVHRLLEAVWLPYGVWLEPAVGQGAILDAISEDDAIPLVDWRTVDLRPSEAADQVADFLELDLDALGRFDVAITNPPFKHAEAFAKRCHAISDFTVMLLRLSFLGSASRSEWLRESTPDVYVLPNRPSFTANGRTDSAEYAWFVWSPFSSGKYEILGTTPREDRR